MEASAPPGQDRWLRDYCASGLYILTLLVEGYGFSEETWGGIEFRQQVTAGGLGGWGRVGLQDRSPAPRSISVLSCFRNDLFTPSFFLLSEIIPHGRVNPN